MKENFLFKKSWGIILILMMMFLSGQVMATVHPIPNSEPDTLKGFIENLDNWDAGDTILLVSPGQYIENSIIEISQAITIMGDPELEKRPEIVFFTKGFVVKDDGLDFTVVIRNINFNGFGDDETSRTNEILGYEVNRPPQKDIIFKDVVIKDVKAKGFIFGLFLEYNKHATYGEITIDNVIWHDFSGRAAVDPRLNFFDTLRVTNSTFYNLTHAFIANPGYAVPDNDNRTVEKVIIIDQNTFWKVGGNNNCLIQINDPKDGMVKFSFTNNIVSQLFQPENARPFRIDPLAGEFIFSNSVMHDYNTSDVSKMHFNFDSIVINQINVSAISMSKADPKYANPEAENFQIPYNSPLHKAGTHGGAIGDPRWTSKAIPLSPNVHRIPNTEPDTLKNFIEDLDNWNPGDTILLISSGQYIENSVIEIWQPITIMGDPVLENRPEIVFFTNGFRVKEQGEEMTVVIRNLDFDGFGDNEASYAEAILGYRVDAPADEKKNVVFKDVIMDDISAKGFTYGLYLEYTNHATYRDITVNDVIWHDFYPNQYAVDPRLNFFDTLRITNSTFYNIANGFLKNPGFPHTNNDMREKEKVIIVDQNTFWKVGGNNNSLIQINDPKDGSVTFSFTNNIVSELFETDNARPFRIDPLAGDFLFSHSTFHNYNTTKVGSTHLNLDSVVLMQENVTAVSIYEDDPEYANPENGFFVLPLGSPLLEAATHGGMIGDLRWLPQEGSITILPVSGRIKETDEIQLQVHVVLGEGADESVTWSVENNFDGTEGEADINEDTGLFTAVKEGKVKIIATSNEIPTLFDELVLTIDKYIEVQSVSVYSFLPGTAAPNSTISELGDSLDIIAIVLPDTAENKAVTWAISDETLASFRVVNGKIVLTALAEGEVTVTATSVDNTDIKGEAVITIKLPTPTPIPTPTGIDEPVSGKLRIFPNPATDYINVEVGGRADIIIYNVLGQPVITKTVNANEKINIQKLEAGIYFMKVKSGDLEKTINFVKQ